MHIRSLVTADLPDIIRIERESYPPGLRESDRRRTGVASTLFHELLRLARALDLARLTLVAVQGSEPFWAKLGFEALERFQYAEAPATRMGRPTLPSR